MSSSSKNSVNDFECVDDSNTAQYFLSLETFSKIFSQLENIDIQVPSKTSSKIKDAIKRLWIGNGDAISYIYTATPSLSAFDLSSPSLFTSLSKAKILVSRIYHLYFTDGTNHDNMRIFLYKYLSKVNKTQLQKHLQHIGKLEFRELYHQPWLIRYFKFLRKYLAPKHLKSFVRFAVSCGWLIAYAIIRRISMSKNLDIVKISKSSMNLGEFEPHLSSVPLFNLSDTNLNQAIDKNMQFKMNEVRLKHQMSF